MPGATPGTRTGALKQIGGQLGIDPETLRNGGVQADAISRSVPASSAAEFDRPSR
jgi:hypothetical protein